LEETPVPIPNTEVKLYSADGSLRESRYRQASASIAQLVRAHDC
jgi:hypothetical protein